MSVLRDVLYEEESHKHLNRMLRILDEYSSMSAWNEKDILGIERALQTLVECLIGIARYTVEQCYDLRMNRSREALDELHRREVLSFKEHQRLMKIIGFRNILVHDYLSINESVTFSILQEKEYEYIRIIYIKLKDHLDQST